MARRKTKSQSQSVQKGYQTNSLVTSTFKRLHLAKGLRLPKNLSVPRCGCKDTCIDLTVALVLDSMDRIFLMLHEA
ncbi:hypothetical protein RHMOL_Rhmol12G0122500 [Rhododendron molle]|uniref:Uncharacterized protein n=1 Tax=Rhododendron molle TaxID=49168 RepID=A0ACC0LIU2_RHOML|nr:hypothetical protein RHMOL_Rhmol12G0122500 [Rhododendron molle]